MVVQLCLEEWLLVLECLTLPVVASQVWPLLELMEAWMLK